VLLLAFGAVILAVLLRALATPLIRHAGMNDRWAILVVVLMLVALGTATFWLFGHQVSAQLTDLAERLPQAAAGVRAWLESYTAGKFVLARVPPLLADGAWLQSVPKFFAVGLNSIGHMLLMFFVGIYLASHPQLYVRGFVRLFPVRQRERLDDALLKSGHALQKWLLGQLVSMGSVGLLTGLGLWLVGAPLPLALGIMAGLLEFIPVIGPVLAFVPAVLVALTEGPQVALSAALVMLVVQQLEGSVIMPIAQRWAVQLPPAYGLIAVLSFGLLFGFLGIFFGSPLAVVLMCLVQHLYVENVLEKTHRRPDP
jgi:predicted PurR-regulated permease PerM